MDFGRGSGIPGLDKPMLRKHNRRVMSYSARVRNVGGDPIGESFEDYLASVEPTFTALERQLYEAFDRSYSLASQIVSLRKQRGWSQAEVARRASVHQSEISRLERGQANVSQSALQRVAAALGVRLGLVDSRGHMVGVTRPT